MTAKTAARGTEPYAMEIAEHVYAYVQPDGGWCVNNSGLLAGGSTALVIDTAATESRALRLRETADSLLAGGAARIVVNTHFHGDHVFGNHVFGPAVTVVAHEDTRSAMAETGLAMTGLWPHVAWGDVRVTLPTVTFRDRLDLHIGDTPVELLHVGPAHTAGDAVVWLPRQRVLFAGDVLMSGCTPFLLMGSISGTLDALTRLRALQPQIVVGGHGPVAGPELFDLTEAYLRWVHDLAAAGAAAGLSPLEAAADADLSRFGDLIDPERLVGNLHRAYDELAGGRPGRPLDVLSVFQEMIAYNDGKLPTCHA